jgi:diguanylate cyclase (GGDEF)-like protein
VVSKSLLEDRVAAYAAWVRNLREGTTPPHLDLSEDPLARLGRELELLSQAVTDRETELRRLFELVNSVESGVLLDDVLDRVFENFRGIIPFDRIGCAFISDDRSRVVAYWAKSELGPVRIAPGFQQPLAGSTLETLASTGQPRIINDLEAYLAAHPTSVSTKRIVEEGGRSSLTCPLLVGGRPFGFLFFTSRQANTYASMHQSVFLQIAGQVSVILEKSRMYEQLVEHNRTLLERTHRLEEMASHDALTGALNRRALDDLLAERVAHASRGGLLGVIMADIDHFKEINDRHGHAAGDYALQEFVHRLSSTLRKGDAVGRYGGEEFLIVIDDLDGAALLRTAERLRASVAQTPFDLGLAALPVTASFGVALLKPGMTAADLVESADAALYEAKTAGRNRCRRADD